MRQIPRQHNYTARIPYVIFFFLLGLGIIAFRLYLLQVAYHNFYKAKAEQQYGVEISVPAPRGEIFDRNGRSLAFNIQAPCLFIMAHEARKDQSTVLFLAKEYPKILSRIQKAPTNKFIWLDRQLPAHSFARLKPKLTKHIHVTYQTKRFYPYQSCTHVVGLTDRDNNGISGIELQLDTVLRGSNQTIWMQKDGRHAPFYFEKKVSTAGTHSSSVSLSIDAKLSELAYQELIHTIKKQKAKKGSVLILDANTGEILTMTNYPVPNTNDRKKINTSVQRNVIINDTFEFGSVLKVFTALAALDEHVTNTNELIDCHGQGTTIGSLKIKNWKPLGVLPFREVVRRSSNVGTAKIALRLKEKLYDHLLRIGFGSKTGVSLPGERSGFVNPPERWSAYSPLVLSFGYEIMGTLLQLGVAFCCIATNGKAIKPQLILEPPVDRTVERQIYSKKSISVLKDILTDPATLFADLRRRYMLPSGYTLMGKTGTARCLVDGKYSEKKHRYTFAGIVQKGLYSRVILTFIQEPKKENLWASQVSAPLFLRIAQRMVINDIMQAMIGR